VGEYGVSGLESTGYVAGLWDGRLALRPAWSLTPVLSKVGRFRVQKINRVALFVTCFLASACMGQSTLTGTSLCMLQRSATEGSHTTVLVSGVFSEGLDLGILEDAACPEETTWVELTLVNKKNRKKLRRILYDSRADGASVVFEGEFYGPPEPDPKLPEAIRKAYHPNWGHSNCCRTKLVVHLIRKVEVAPKGPGANGTPN